MQAKSINERIQEGNKNQKDAYGNTKA